MKFFALISAFLFMAVSAMAATHVAVLETVSENGVIGRCEKIFLTDKIRERAKAVLPAYMGYVVMTRENLNAMLPPGKSIGECEGSCLVETGKNIAADYVAQARVGKFGKQLTLTMELYETAGNNLVGSFTARKPDAEGLLEEIEREADRIFAQIVGTGAPVVGGSEGISGVSTGGSGYRASGVKSYIVRVESSPTGAMFSVDGRVNASCNRTPCDITLPTGSHRFSFSIDMYFDKDETVDVNSNGQKVSAELVPNFGELTIAPLFEGGMGNLDESEVLIDGKKMQGGSFRLSVGSHKVQISHRCYETVSFNASVKNGSKIRFDQAMRPLLGGLEMEALLDDKPKLMPVYVNGKKMGETPFLETVPICAKVQIGNDKEEVPVELKAGETVKFTYKGNGSTLVDKRDGKKYKTVKIGNQTWMAENLNYEMQDSYCYRNDESNCSKYGRLYSWKAALYACPVGWHLPSKKELEKLFSSVGGKEVAGKSLKFKKGWNNGGNGTDAFAFSALPAGNRYDDGNYNREGNNAYFWSSTEDDSYYAYNMSLYYNGDGAGLYSSYESRGFSVRCLKDDNGLAESSVDEHKDVDDENSSVEILVDKRDGKKYKTVQIGNQTWMAENLNYKTQDSYCYRNDESNCSKYGSLYQWNAAVKACPSGWHLPSKKELEKLFSSVGGKEVAGKSLKFKKGWNNGGDGTDAFAFSALPAGGWYYYGGYNSEGDDANFWSSTEDNSDRAYYMYLYYDNVDANLNYNLKNYRFSVRCLKD